MRDIDATSLAALAGSRAGDTITVFAWYAGNLVLDEPLNISGWGLEWDATRQVQTLSLDVVDPTGLLIPRLYDDVLGIGGTELQVIYSVGGASTVNMGWYRIVASKPSETWRSYIINKAGQINTDSPIPPNKKLAFVSTGGIIKITAEDRAGNIGRDKLEAPESPQGTTPTIMTEIVRLVGDTCPVVALDTVVDRDVNKTLIYADDRLDAVQDLCKRIGCDYRMNGDGQLEVYPTVPTAPVWELFGGPGGVIVSVDWEQNIQGKYNVFIAEGTATLNGKQYPVRGRASITAGPMAEGGEFGTIQTNYSSTMLTTQQQCNDYAVIMRDTYLAGLTVTLNVTCAPHPALQQGETVLVASPVVDGEVVSLVGTVETMALKSAGGTVDPMQLAVVCPYDTVAIAFGGVFRG